MVAGNCRSAPGCAILANYPRGGFHDAASCSAEKQIHPHQATRTRRHLGHGPTRENRQGHNCERSPARGCRGSRDYSLTFDHAEIANFEVTQEEKLRAVADLDPQTCEDTEFAIANVRRFAEAQLATILPLEIESLPGLHLGHRVIPIETVGCYVPGGRYPLLSAPVVTIVPAKVAGCDQVIAYLPPTAHPAMIAGCHLAGAGRIFRVGGAQAIAAMAYGTETIPAVDKIVGPGNALLTKQIARYLVRSASTNWLGRAKSLSSLTKPLMQQ